MHIKNRITTIICLFIMMCLLVPLTSCNESNDDEGNVDKTKEIALLTDTPSEDRILNDLQTVSTYSIVPSDKDNPNYDVYYIMNGNVICREQSTESHHRFAIYAPNGTLSETVSVARPDIQARYFDCYLLPSGNLVTVQTTETRGICTVSLSDADGVILASCDIEGSYSSYDIAFDDDIIAIHTNSIIYCFSSDLTLLSQTPYSTSQYGPMAGVHEGQIAFESYSKPKSYALNPYTGELASMQGYDKPERVHHGAKLFFGDGYDAYFKDLTGIWGYTKETASADLLLEWSKTEYSEDNTYIIAAINDTTFLANVIHPLSRQYELMILHTDETAAAPKTEIRIGLIRGLQDSGKLAALLSAFNMQSTEYHLTLIDYSQAAYEPSGGVSDPSLSLFEEDLLSGNVPDIMVFGTMGQMTYQELLEKDLFLDLSPYLGDLLLPNVKTAYTDTRGALYQIPAYMTMYVLASSDESMVGKDTFTLDVFEEVLTTLDDGEVMFVDSPDGRGVSFRLPKVVNASFYNAAEKTCWFNTSAYHSYIHSFCADWEHTNAQPMTGIDTNGYTTNAYLSEDIADGKLKFLEVALNSTEMYMMTKTYFGEKDVSFFGYPSDDGQAGYMDSEISFAVTKESEVLRGAVAVLKYFLSDMVQLSRIITSSAFPVTAQGVEQQLDAYPYYYFENPRMMDTEETVYYTSGFFNKQTNALDSALIEGSHLIERVMTAEEKEELRDLLFHMPLVGLTDETIEKIVIDEISAYSNGVRSVEEAAEIIQSRVSTYLSE